MRDTPMPCVPIAGPNQIAERQLPIQIQWVNAFPSNVQRRWLRNAKYVRGWHLHPEVSVLQGYTDTTYLQFFSSKVGAVYYWPSTNTNLHRTNVENHHKLRPQ